MTTEYKWEDGASSSVGTITNWIGAWATSTAYTLGDGVQNDGSSYICILAHTSGAASEPGTGASWETYWDLVASKGEKGDTGEQGPTGLTGPQGTKGDKGDKGDTGATGPAGPQGETGLQGSQGIQGVQGEKGDTGATGAQGPKGDKGANWRGAYDGPTAYVVDDLVSYNGSTYICILDSTGNLPTDTTYWSLVALKGNDGAGSGDVTGPASSTDNGIVRFDGTTGKLIQNSTNVVIDDSGQVGIGIGSPSTRLHLAGTTSNDNMTIDTGINFTSVSSPTAPTLSLVAQAGNVNAGTHYYTVTYVTARGETSLSANNSIVTDASNGQVTVTLPVSTDYRVTKRRIYRTKANGAYYNIYLLAEVSDNTTTTYTDNLADSSLGTVNAYLRTNTTNDFIKVNGKMGFFLDGANAWVGSDAGARTTSGGANTLFGANAGYGITSGDRIVAIGQSALSSGTVTSEGHVAIGYATLSNVTSGAYNVAMGYQSGLGLTGGYNNTYLGYVSGFAGQNVSNNTYIGALAGRYETGSNKLIIDSLDRGNEAASRTNALIYGVVNSTASSQILALGGGGNVGIGTTSPTACLHIKAGTATAGTAPIKLTSGTVNTTPEAGAIEFDGTDLYITI